MDNWFNVGKIVNTHGIKGEVRVVSRTDFADERYRVGNDLYLFFPEKQEPVHVVVKSHRTHKQFDLLEFEGFDNVNQVEVFKNALIKVPEEQLTELDEGEFYFHQIIGCTVITESGEEIGKITEVLTPGANDVWVVKGKNGKEILIPYIEDIVKEINIDEKRIRIEVMEGLL
ncbi:ribosome maturation factor RimM [Litchfieldia salsa]|uniref:Ribosome maturation factor RimM n=1 Tax=Litchfieldia salsa TaxID=930152 RepID=A0A1H0R937_9BACI|nr:ribosome maturation factor RimM [Litchfieldia salsa]SDP26062.1 16S rRNA processing protein RimM [Litchfieldia salsa]